MTLRLLAFSVCLLGTFAWPAGDAPPEGRRLKLTDGSLFIPAAAKPDIDGAFDLTLHLHGAAGVVEQNFVAAQSPGVLANVTLPGLSAVYAAHFRDTNVFWRIVREAEAHLQSAEAPKPRVRRLTVSCFSAGFGGVRELLENANSFARIDALLMADSIYAGFQGDPAERQVSAANMEGFLRFAQEAVAGRKRLLISHSQLHTPTYASTVETADYLIARLDGRRQAVTEDWLGGLKLRSRYQQGQCEILGFDGDTGEHHMQHLRQLGRFLERLRQPGKAPESRPATQLPDETPAPVKG